MTECCENKACALEELRERQSSTLKTVLWINAAMFAVVLGAGLYASSSALLADSLDNLGDALTYALSLYAVGRSSSAPWAPWARWRSRQMQPASRFSPSTGRRT